jgi:hypothetical protein
MDSCSFKKMSGSTVKSKLVQSLLHNKNQNMAAGRQYIQEERLRRSPEPNRRKR